MGIIFAGGTGSDDTLFDEIVKIASFKKALYIGYSNMAYVGGYFSYIKGIVEKLGGTMEALTKEDLYNSESAEAKIKNADLIYVAGGNTVLMMKRLRASGIDQMLKNEVLTTDKIFCGLSAGGIIWFDYGCSDSRKYKRNSRQRVMAKGLGIYHLFFAPHIVSDQMRQENFEVMMKRYSGIGLELENSAIVIKDGKYKTLKLWPDTIVCRKAYKKNGQLIREDIQTDEFLPIEKLLVK